MEIEDLRAKLLEEVSKLPEDQVAGLKERIEGMDADELQEFVKQQSLAGCFFCQITSGKTDTIRIYESANILAILDINPANPGHMLIMPKQHYQFITQLPQDVFYEIFAFVKHVSPVLLKVTGAQGIDVYAAQGISQKVPHLAINLIPRFSDDKIEFSWKRKKVSKDELEEIASKIREGAKSIALEAAKPSMPEKKEKKGKKEKTEDEKETEAMLKFYKGKTS